MSELEERVERLERLARADISAHRDCPENRGHWRALGLDGTELDFDRARSELTAEQRQFVEEMDTRFSDE